MESLLKLSGIKSLLVRHQRLRHPECVILNSRSNQFTSRTIFSLAKKKIDRSLSKMRNRFNFLSKFMGALFLERKKRCFNILIYKYNTPLVFRLKLNTVTFNISSCTIIILVQQAKDWMEVPDDQTTRTLQKLSGRDVATAPICHTSLWEILRDRRYFRFTFFGIFFSNSRCRSKGELKEEKKNSQRRV